MGWERAGSKTPLPDASGEVRGGPFTRTPPFLLPSGATHGFQQPPPLAISSCAAPLEQRRLRANGGGDGEGDLSFPWEAPMGCGDTLAKAEGMWWLTGQAEIHGSARVSVRRYAGGIQKFLPSS